MNSVLRPRALKDQVAQLPGDGIVLRDLHIVLGARGLMSGRHAAIDPIRPIEKSPRPA